MNNSIYMSEKYNQLKVMFTHSDVRFNENLSKHCTWQIGGPADVFIEPRSVRELQDVVKGISLLGLPRVVIGDGSNLLFADEGVRGVVVKIGPALSRIQIDGNIVRAEAGVWVPELARRTGREGLSGLEHTIGIPGRIGGLVCMNGGSQRENIGAVIDKVYCIEPDGSLKEFLKEGCSFSYRNSRFLDSQSVVAKVDLQLIRSEWPVIRRAMRDILKSRRAKFPRKLPNCGSVFKSDSTMYKIVGPPGKMIEECGFKGKRVGGAEVSALHANFIVNTGSARAEDVLALIADIRRCVFEKFGVMMETEVRYVSPAGTVFPGSEAAG